MGVLLSVGDCPAEELAGDFLGTLTKEGRTYSPAVRFLKSDRRIWADNFNEYVCSLVGFEGVSLACFLSRDVPFK